MCENDLSIRKVLRDIRIFAVTFLPRHCLGRGKVALCDSFDQILCIMIQSADVLMCIQNVIKMSHTVEDLWRLPYFHIFASALSWSKTSKGIG